MSETSLPTLMKEIGEALRLDNDNHDKEAYKKYVSCIYKIATNLILAMKLAGGDVCVDSKTSRQVKLVQQCVERVADLVEKLGSTRSKSDATTPTDPSPACTPTSHRNFTSTRGSQNGSEPSTPVTLQSTQAQQVTPSQQSQPSTPVDQPDGRLHSRFTAPVPSLPQERNPYSYRSKKSRALTPMEIAKKQNQSLMAAYKARMERLNRSDFNAFSYSLTIQRKMAENIAIAQAQEEELARKMQARNQRLEEEAAKRFATPVGMSEEEQEQRQIYKKILAYENDAKWLQEWRSKLEANPEDPILISQLVQEILRCADHPFTELLKKYQFKIYERLYPLVAKKQVDVDKIKVPMAKESWPSLTEVTDILEDGMGLRSPKSPSPKRFRKAKDEQETSEEHTGNDKKNSEDAGGDSDISSAETSDKEKNTSSSKVEVKDTESSKKTPKCSHGEEDENRNSKSEEYRSENKDTYVWNDPLNVRSESQSSLKNLQGDASKESEGFDEVDSKSSVSDKKENRDSNFDSVSADRKEESGSETQQGKNSESDASECSKDNKNKSSEKPDAAVDSDSDNIDNGSHMAKVTAKTKKDLQLALDKGQELESQLSWERKQAQILMRQVTEDYSNYDMKHSDFDDDNLDYLFDDDDDDDDEYNCYASAAKSAFSSKYVPRNESSSSEETQNATLDRSISHQPSSSRQISEEDEQRFQSLPTSMGQDDVDGKKKKIEQLSREAYQRHLQSIADDVHRFLEKLLVMMTIAYEPLDTPVGKDQCAVSLEEPFFKPIWKTLLKLYRAVNHKEELVLACVMTGLSEATPEDLKVSKRFRLADSTSDERPYERAISQLRHVQDHYTMLSKLDCIVKVCRLICECVDDHYKKKDDQGEKSGKKAPSIGADDLLPIFTYVVIQSALPQLGTECQILTEFIHEGYMMGEEGYCLTTMRTALNYVMSLFPSIVES